MRLNSHCRHVWRGVAIIVVAVNAALSHADDLCRRTSDNSHIQISAANLVFLEKFGLDKAKTLKLIEAASIPETQGCWSSPTGDTDGQILSVGFAQWNFGQATLVPLLEDFKKSDPGLVETLMPTYGRRLFSSGCLRVDKDKKWDATRDCRDFLKTVQTRGRLNADFSKEVSSLFESDRMTQLQVDHYLRLLTGLESQLNSLFVQVERPLTPLRLKWSMDMKIHQGSFPNREDAERIRARWAVLSKEEKKSALESIVFWYSGLCRLIDSRAPLDQEGVRLDCDRNSALWSEIVQADKFTEEAADLILLSHIKARIAAGKGGLYQAVAFQRRAKIAFTKGSNAGRMDP